MGSGRHLKSGRSSLSVTGDNAPSQTFASLFGLPESRQNIRRVVCKSVCQTSQEPLGSATLAPLAACWLEKKKGNTRIVARCPSRDVKGKRTPCLVPLGSGDLGLADPDAWLQIKPRLESPTV